MIFREHILLLITALALTTHKCIGQDGLSGYAIDWGSSDGPADTLEEDTTVYIVYIPYHSWSVGLGYSSLPAVVKNLSLLPDNLELQWWLGNRFYMQAGLFTQPDGVVPDNLFFSRGFALYAGVLIKLFMFPKAYFTPSLNVYYDQFVKDPNKQFAVTAGPAIGFEYFFDNRFSAASNLFGGGYGWARQTLANNNSRYSIHWAMGLALRYNFDMRPLAEKLF